MMNIVWKDILGEYLHDVKVHYYIFLQVCLAPHFVFEALRIPLSKDPIHLHVCPKN